MPTITQNSRSAVPTAYAGRTSYERDDYTSSVLTRAKDGIGRGGTPASLRLLCNAVVRFLKPCTAKRLEKHELPPVGRCCEGFSRVNFYDNNAGSPSHESLTGALSHLLNQCYTPTPITTILTITALFLSRTDSFQWP